jgi:hypothetical protein
MAAAFETLSCAWEEGLEDVEDNFEVLNDAQSRLDTEGSKGDENGADDGWGMVGDVHRISGTSVLERARRGTKDFGGIERRNRGGSGSGLRDEWPSDEWRVNGK